MWVSAGEYMVYNYLFAIALNFFFSIKNAFLSKTRLKLQVLVIHIFGKIRSFGKMNFRKICTEAATRGVL